MSNRTKVGISKGEAIKNVKHLLKATRSNRDLLLVNRNHRIEEAKSLLDGKGNPTPGMEDEYAQAKVEVAIMTIQVQIFSQYDELLQKALGFRQIEVVAGIGDPFAKKEEAASADSISEKDSANGAGSDGPTGSGLTPELLQSAAREVERYTGSPEPIEVRSPRDTIGIDAY